MIGGQKQFTTVILSNESIKIWDKILSNFELTYKLSLLFFSYSNWSPNIIGIEGNTNINLKTYSLFNKTKIVNMP